METEETEPSQSWNVNDLCDFLDMQDGLERIHLMISDVETGEVFGTSEWSIIRNGNNLTFSGVRFNRKKPT